MMERELEKLRATEATMVVVREAKLSPGMISLIQDTIKSEIAALLKEKEELSAKEMRSFYLTGSYSTAVIAGGLFYISFAGYISQLVGVPLALAFLSFSVAFFRGWWHNR